MRRTRLSPPPWRCCCSAWFVRSKNIHGRTREQSHSRALAWGLSSVHVSLRASSRPTRLSPCSSSRWEKRAARVGEFIWRIVPALALGFLIMGLLWPWSILAPLNPVRAAEYFDKFFEKPWRELYAGKIISVTAMPADYLPRLFAFKLPEIMLVLGLAGVAGAFFAATRRQLPLNRRASFVLVALAAILPVLVAILAHPAFYNGLRHFVFVVPPFAAIGGLAGAWLFERAHALGKVATAALVAIFVGSLALPLSDMVRLHPYQYTAFNWASGGVQMAHDNYMLDYWGLAFKQTGAALRG